MKTEKPLHEPLNASSVGLDAGDIFLDEHGREIPDPVPMAPPVGYKRQPSLVELVRDMVRGENLRQAAMAEDKDTFEEFDNFDVPDELQDPHTRWENDFDPPVKDLLKEGDKSLRDKEKSRAASERPKPASEPATSAEPKATPPKPSSEA